MPAVIYGLFSVINTLYENNFSRHASQARFLAQGVIMLFNKHLAA